MIPSFRVLFSSIKTNTPLEFDVDHQDIINPDKLIHIVVCNMYRHHFTKEWIRECRYEYTGTFGSSFVSYKTLDNEDFTKLLNCRVKKEK